MKCEDLGIYELLEERAPAPPPPSRLYRIAPIGIGTPFVESLSSYVGRLAAAHTLSVSSLVRYEISPLLSHTYLQPDKTTSNSFRAAGAMNGRCKTAAEWVDALSQLTLRDDIVLTTFLPFKEIVTDRGLLRTTRAWCPQCFEDWRNGEMPVYEPLIWKVRSVKICPVHLGKLRSGCPYCGSDSKHIESLFVPGYCPSCGKWLGDTVGYGTPEHEIYDLLWAANSVGDLVALALPSAAWPTKTNMMAFFDYLITERTKGGMRALARLLKVDHTYVIDWRNGEYLPSFDNLLRICAMFRITLREIACMEFTVHKFGNGSAFPAPTGAGIPVKKQTEINWDSALEDLSAMAAGEEPSMQIAALAERFQCSVSSLYRNYSTLCQVVTARNTEMGKKEREEHYESLKRELTEKVRSSLDNGRRPLKTELYKIAGGRSAAKAKLISEVFEETILDDAKRREKRK